ncbi:FecR domain-containing protein [Parapedobacter sp. ISTM3]|uniref:FecR family protein n=1 Tax=Parapedobacter sp. ISTM3 TaxID=2800130 RepID=UPI001905A618|nr:FecR family protein [Parapedobacter sp. ISTM3]MBK1438881.1 FecR domain-containing protein [Parapedobacter sp. ISTM3]
MAKQSVTVDGEKFQKLLQRYLDGQATDNEKRALDQWYDTRRELGNHELFSDKEHENRVKMRMAQRIERHWTTPKRSRIWRLLPYAAASLIIIAGVASSLFYKSRTQGDEPHALAAVQYREVTTAVHQVKKIMLPDSSQIWINAQSRIRIPEPFENAQKREIFLDEGEAFFEVAPNPEKPFIVHHGTMHTEVLGTAFNIRNYRQLEHVIVGVQHGKVSVTSSGQHAFYQELTALQQLVYDTKAAAFSRGTIASENLLAGWRTGVIDLYEASIDELALALRNLYGVELKLGAEHLRDHRYTLTIRSTHRLEETMKVICSVHHNQYRRKNNEVIIY